MATTKKRPATTKKVATSAKRGRKPARMSSFKLHKEASPFLTFAITKQSLYWLILSAIVLLQAMWTLNLTVKIHAIYDQTESNIQDAAVLEIPDKSQ